jgi:hypothetical protein
MKFCKKRAKNKQFVLVLFLLRIAGASALPALLRAVGEVPATSGSHVPPARLARLNALQQDDLDKD